MTDLIDDSFSQLIAQVFLIVLHNRSDCFLAGENNVFEGSILLNKIIIKRDDQSRQKCSKVRCGCIVFEKFPKSQSFSLKISNERIAAPTEDET